MVMNVLQTVSSWVQEGAREMPARVFGQTNTNKKRHSVHIWWTCPLRIYTWINIWGQTFEEQDGDQALSVWAFHQGCLNLRPGNCLCVTTAMVLKRNSGWKSKLCQTCCLVETWPCKYLKCPLAVMGRIIVTFTALLHNPPPGDLLSCHV